MGILFKLLNIGSSATDSIIPILNRPYVFPIMVAGLIGQYSGVSKYELWGKYAVTTVLSVPLLQFLKISLMQLFMPFSAWEFFWLQNCFHDYIKPAQLDLVEHVLTTATPNSPESVVKAIDEYCWKHPTMNLGDVKGKIVDEVLVKYKPKVAVELGAYIGYSAVRFANLLEDNAILYSVDPNTFAECIKTKMVSFAGVSNKVKNYYGFSNNFLEEFAKDKNNKIDFLFVDHVKELYKQDVELAVNLGLLQKGSVVVADNVLYPGSPEYRKWMLANPRFKTEVKLTYIEYSNTIRDEVLISEFLG